MAWKNIRSLIFILVTFFFVKSQAFNNTTLVLRKDLLNQGVENFDFITSDETVNEVRKILNSEVVKKHALTFSIALTISFIKYGTDGEVIAKASPCFLSKVNYLNCVSRFNVRELIQTCVLQIQKRYDDFVDKGMVDERMDYRRIEILRFTYNTN